MAESQPVVAEHKPYIADDANVAEFTPKAVIIGAVFGLIFGASTVYLALKAGLTVSASIPIAVLSISLLKKFGGSTILENNLVQTIGSAGESIAAGVVFTLPGFLFLAMDPVTKQSVGAPYFSYWTIFTLALLGGMLGVLMMVPLRRALIVKEHGNLPYPEGAACAQVLIAGEQGGDMAKTAYQGLFFAFGYATLQQIFKVIAETPGYVSRATSKIFPAATLNGSITPEYLGVGYIIGPKIAGVLVAGGVLAWLGLIPLLASLVPADSIALQLNKLGYLADLTRDGAYGWNATTHTFGALNRAIYFAYVRQIGAGAVAAGGFMTLLKTLPTIISSFKGSLASLREGPGVAAGTARTSRDLPISLVLFGSVALVAIMAFLPFLPGSFGGRALLGVLIVVFGFFFVTVASRIVGLIGTSSNPVSGMTIATLMATCLIFVGIGWTSDIYQPMALCVGGMVCIAAANAGATSQDLKTGYLVGATPRHQQVGLMVGAVAASIIIGITMKVLDNPTTDAMGIVHHAIGSERYPAPQGTLMATLIKGLLAHNLDWQFVLVGVFLAVTIELCGVSPLSFAVGAYLPLSTTLPIWVGGAIKGLVDRYQGKKSGGGHDEDLGPGSLFSTGLVAGGALAGVLVAILSVDDRVAAVLKKFDLEPMLSHALGEGGYEGLGVVCFAVMCGVLFKVATKKAA